MRTICAWLTSKTNNIGLQCQVGCVSAERMHSVRIAPNSKLRPPTMGEAYIHKVKTELNY